MAAAADVIATMIEAEVDATMTAEVAMTIAEDATNSDMWCLIELSLGRMLLSKTFMI